MSPLVGKLSVTPTTQGEAEEIAGWRYEPPYDFYDARSDEENLARLLDADRRRDRTFTVRDDGGEIIGFFTFSREDDAIVVGLGLRPDRTGRGLGSSFVGEALAFGRARYAPRRFRLSVAAFNTRAIAVYERAGFVRTGDYEERTNGGVYSFLEMERVE